MTSSKVQLESKIANTSIELTKDKNSPISTLQGDFYLFSYADRFVDTRKELSPGSSLSRGGLRLEKLKTALYPNGNCYIFSSLFNVLGRDGQLIPEGITAIQGTITVTQINGDGFLKILAGDVDPKKGTSVLSFQSSNNPYGICNHFICPVSCKGVIQIVISHTNAQDPAEVHCILDIAGYWLPKKK
jgi:hypothetical protein